MICIRYFALISRLSFRAYLYSILCTVLEFSSRKKKKNIYIYRQRERVIYIVVNYIQL